MELKKTNFYKDLAFGEEGEKNVAIKLIEKGYTVLPLYQFENNHAPLMYREFQNFISPDLTIFNKGKAFFIEVKSKKRWIEYNGIRETGCNYLNYLHYKKLSEVTGIELYLIFNHILNHPKGMFYVKVNQKGRYWSGVTKSGNKVSRPMYFWNYLDLKIFE